MTRSRQVEGPIHLLIEKHRNSMDREIGRVEGEKRQSTTIFENRVALSVAETAVTLGLSPRSVERMISRGDLRVRRVGRRVLIPKDELGAWLNRKE